MGEADPRLVTTGLGVVPNSIEIDMAPGRHPFFDSAPGYAPYPYGRGRSNEGGGGSNEIAFLQWAA
jgi:hypothetical protein